jgi:hypothetical protein
MSKKVQLLSPGPRPGVRRHSTVDATFADLAIGPSIVMPPKSVEDQEHEHETAAALELAKHRLSQASSGEVSEGVSTAPSTPPESSATDAFAFAFDIDGVLIRGGKPIPEAIEAIKVLNGQNKYGIKV